MPAVTDMGETQACHPKQAVDVRLEDDLLVLLAAFPERVPAKPEPRVVDEDVEPAERIERRRDEALAASGVGDVQLERHDSIWKAVRVPRAGGHADVFGEQGARDRGADSGGCAGDDCRLACESHDARL